MSPSTIFEYQKDYTEVSRITAQFNDDYFAKKPQLLKELKELNDEGQSPGEIPKSEEY